MFSPFVEYYPFITTEFNLRPIRSSWNVLIFEWQKVIKIRKTNQYFYSTGNKYIIKSSVWNDSLKEFNEIIKEYVLNKKKKISNTTINCSLCSEDEINFFINDKKYTPNKKSYFIAKKGELTKIELLRDGNKYLSINNTDIKDKGLLFQDNLELSDIVNNYLIDNNLEDQNKDLVKGTYVCFQEKSNKYKLTFPSEFNLDKFLIKWNGYDSKSKQFEGKIDNNSITFISKMSTFNIYIYI